MMSGTDILLSDIRIAWIWVITTFGTAIGSLLAIVPDNIGKAGVLLTATLSVILIRVQMMNLKNARIDRKIKERTLQNLEREERERVEHEKDAA